MGYFSSPKDFELPNGLFPHHFEKRVEDILDKIKMGLNDRSIDELNLFAKGIEWMLKDELEFLINYAKKIGAAHFIDEDYNPSKPQLLLTCFPSIDVSDQSQIKNPSWSEYFSVLALMLIKDAIESVATSTDQSMVHEPQILESTATAVLDALQAIMMSIDLRNVMTYAADHSKEVNELEAKHAESKRKGANARHNDTHVLLDELVDFYNGGGYTNYSSTVQDFLEQTPEAKYNHLVPTNRVRTLTEGLSKIIRGKRTLPEF